VIHFCRRLALRGCGVSRPAKERTRLAAAVISGQAGGGELGEDLLLAGGEVFGPGEQEPGRAPGVRGPAGPRRRGPGRMYWTRRVRLPG
jgi:hypothetical protein